MTDSQSHRGVIAVMLAIAYITIMGIGMWLMHHRFGLAYGDPEEMTVLVWVEVALTLLTIGGTVLFFSLRFTGYRRPDYSGLKWLIPPILLLAAMIATAAVGLTGNPPNPMPWGLIGLVAVTTFLVGLSEEGMFRGIVLHAFARQATVAKGVIISSVLFSLLHAVNIFGGALAVSLPVQLLLTFLMGFYFALLAVRIGSILPLILFHWVWDFVLIGTSVNPEVSPFLFPFGVLFGLLNLVMSIFLWRSLGPRMHDKLTAQPPRP